MNKSYINFMQLLFIGGITLGSRAYYYENINKWLDVVRYILYLLTILAIPECSKLVYSYHTTRSSELWKQANTVRSHGLLYLGSATLLLYSNERLFKEDFPFIFLAYFIVKYSDMSPRRPISYGVGMACSYFEGYLTYVLPADGAGARGFEANIGALEDGQGVLFPAKKLFIVLTSSLYCPPDLALFNKTDDRLPSMEQFHAANDVVRSVAGVANRSYHSTAYKIYRPPAAGPPAAGPPAPGAPPRPWPVCVVAECATPLHTLHRVISNRALYSEIGDIDVEEVVKDFSTTLRKILGKSPQCRGKCEIIEYDDEDPNQNLSDLLLDRIRQLEPKFEEKIIDRMQQNILRL